MEPDDDFAARTRRHFASLRQRPPGDGNAVSFPDDWFDLSVETLADFGAMFYLASMVAHHRARSLAAAVATLEPALRLGQYHIFRSNGFPRAFVTWAGLDEARERRFALDHSPLAPEDWNTGASIWLVDFVAPFGHFDQMVEQLTRNPKLDRLRALWHDADGEGYRIVEWMRLSPTEPIVQKMYNVARFAKILKAA
ncbi:MAG: toxin-activating lysine-acyltransferase [Albidovulum sp.]